MLLKVYEEKERSWERELRKIKALYENRMKANQQKVELLPQQNMKIIMTTITTMIMTIMMMQASKMEQALMNQTLQVQNEKRKLESELEDVQVIEEKMRILRSEGSRDVSL